jgi:hypothetical protein
MPLTRNFLDMNIFLQNGSYIAFFVTIISVLTGLATKKNYQYHKPSKVMLWFMVLLLVFHAVESLVIFNLHNYHHHEFSKQFIIKISSWGFIHTQMLSPFNYLIKFACIGLFVYYVMPTDILKKLFGALSVALVLFELTQLRYHDGYDSWSSTLKNFFILAGISIFLFHFYKTQSLYLPLVKNSYFWFSMALFLPALTNIYIEFVLQKLYVTDLSLFEGIYAIRNVFELIGMVFIAVGFWQTKYLKFIPK